MVSGVWAADVVVEGGFEGHVGSGQGAAGLEGQRVLEPVGVFGLDLRPRVPSAMRSRISKNVITMSPRKSTLLKASGSNTGWVDSLGDAVPGGGGDQVDAQAVAGGQGGQGGRGVGEAGRRVASKAAVTAATSPSISVASSSLRKAISSRATG